MDLLLLLLRSVTDVVLIYIGQVDLTAESVHKGVVECFSLMRECAVVMTIVQLYQQGLVPPQAKNVLV